MSLRSALHRFSARRRNVWLLIAVVAAICGFMTWREWQSAPVRRHIDTGVRLLQSGQNGAAEREWREAVRLDPDNAHAWELLGDFYLAAESWPAAREAFHHVLKLRPGTPDLYGRLAYCDIGLNDLQAAQQHAQAELQQDSDDIAALRVMAVVTKSNHPEEHLKYLRRLAELQPQDVEALAALASQLTVRYEYDQARPLIDRILRLDPNYHFAYLLRGLAYFNQDPTPQGLAQAAANFQKVLELKPQDVEAHRYLGRIYLRLGKPRQAIEHFEAVGRGRPYASAHFLELANAYRKAGDVRRADEFRRRFTTLKQLNFRMVALHDRIEREPKKFENYLQLGLLLLHSIEADADSYYLYHFRYVKQEIKDPESYLKKALELRPRDPRALAAMRQLERAYVQRLQASAKAFDRRDGQQANWNLAHAIVLRPTDSRTREAIQQVAWADRRPASNSVLAQILNPPQGATLDPQNTPRQSQNNSVAADRSSLRP
ncbi:MAG: tetratricopeptide repeat protein [Armatimonadota bacterium]|nr:tetratricopeptide repeat protein [Armatimonadota bacterium]